MKYRVRFETLAAKATANLIIAAADVSGKKINPMWISANGSYETGEIDGGKRYPVQFRQDL